MLSGNDLVIGLFVKSENESHEAREAFYWAMLNNEHMHQSSARLQKAQKVYDRVMAEIRKNPLIRRYIEGLPAYIARKEKELREGPAEIEGVSAQEQKSLEQKIKGMPDPFDSLVALIE